MPPKVVVPDLEEKAAEVADLAAQAADLEADAKHAREVADAAAADHAAAVEAAEFSKVDPKLHVFVEQGSSVAVVEAPAGSDTDHFGHVRQRSLSLSGVNVEHVGEKVVVDADEVKHTIWVYRRM